MSQLCGVALVDKPVGPTSHDVVAAIRRASGQRRVGHAGTLDPLASGLLIVCLGPATRVAQYLTQHDKVYQVEARLGVETDTYDAEGEVVAEWTEPLPTDEAVDDAIASLCGEVLQVPPVFSAVKVGGTPLYRLARQGKPVQARPRRVMVHSIRWSRPEPQRLVLRVHCSAGTYVRSLVQDLGRRLGCGAHVAALRRLASGPFSVSQALPLAEAVSRLERGEHGWMLDVGEALPEQPRLLLDGDAAQRLARGQAIEGPPPSSEDLHLAIGPDGRAFAVAEWDWERQSWIPRKVLIQECDP
ncbi:MAG: tRNA pseudouridine(55) synthase TruB [Anaerolineae bacterium]|nr:tRNA pseudouridine(55) synthase TruB [Anaerolineae bacterium]